MKKIIDILGSLWLNDKEVKIYLASLWLWQTTASILWQKAWIARSTSQYTCNALVEKRLMNITPQGNSFLYSPEPPEKLISMVNKEYNVVDKKMQNIHSIMSELNNFANPNARLPDVKYYTWVEWVIDILKDVLSEKEDFYAIFNYVEDTHPEVQKFLSWEYTEKRNKNNITSKAIYNSTDETREYIKNSKSVNRILLWVPREDFPFEVWMHIYWWNKVALFSLSRNDLSWVVIKNKNVHKTFASMFKMSWNYARTLPENEKYKNVVLQK